MNNNIYIHPMHFSVVRMLVLVEISMKASIFLFGRFSAK